MRKYLAMLGAAALVVTGLCGLGAQSAYADGTLPSPWTDTDVGSPAIAGSASYSNGVFTVNGNGVDIWGSSDQFNYVYQPMTGDESIVARVTSQTAADPWSKAGVMVKQSTTAGSTYALLAVTPGNGISFQYGFNQYTSGTSYTFPAWLKMTFYGASGTVIAYSSPDGINWAEVGSTTISMAYPATIGLFSTSHTPDGGGPNVLSTATFDNVSVTPAPPAPTGEQPPSGVVSATPASNTPHLKATDDNPTEQIRQLVQCGNTMYAVGSFSTIIRGQHDLHPRQHLQLQRHHAVHGDELGSRCRGHRRNTSEQRHDQHHRVRQRQLRRRLHRRQVHLGQRHHRHEHRRDRHHHRQRGQHLREQGRRLGADHGRRGQSPAGRRRLHRHQRRHHRPVHGRA